jgi:ribosomal protein S18 acetylase RimI-like enzyme
MTTIRRFTTDDMFRFNNINLDHLTETYNLNFYLQYLAQWPEYFLVHEAPEGRLTSYGEAHPGLSLRQLPSEPRPLACQWELRLFPCAQLWARLRARPSSPTRCHGTGT